MGWFGMVGKLSVLVFLCAAFFMMPMFEEQRRAVTRLLSTCPMHWFNDVQQQSGNLRPPENSIVLRDTKTVRVISPDELRLYDGSEGSKGIYVAYIGCVFDVSTGAKFYSPGSGYSVFAAKDASRAFVTGDFSPTGLVDDVSGLTSSQWLEMLQWFQFYFKTYPFVAKVEGRFYDKDGAPTAELLNAQSDLDRAFVAKQHEDDQRKIFPPCNSHWKEGSGTTVWCSTKSGGIERDWEGVPRKLFDPAKQTTHCVCVRTTGPPSDSSMPNKDNGDIEHPNLRPYDDCPPHSNACTFF